MTKKHFEALADGLHSTKQNGLPYLQWIADCEAVADVCESFNPNFDRARFLAACGVGERT